MKRIRLFWKILRTTHADAFLYGFFAYFGVTVVLMRVVEPHIRTIGDRIWYCYVSCATIGFGDYTTVTTLGRILTILLSVYAIFIIALIPGGLVSYQAAVSGERRRFSGSA
ncbi:ion channel [Candidatus Soleaferrea massiliensis]|uniref:ion channel n=1 Tax=Candidatus Soleaferrea massiliensis TaxID=1470354 RepID=UPI000693264C|nr:ion channel [Candidatus Soleaferrea massiliensis]